MRNERTIIQFGTRNNYVIKLNRKSNFRYEDSKKLEIQKFRLLLLKYISKIIILHDPKIILS